MARFAYEVGSGSNEIRKLRWEYLDADWTVIRVAWHTTKGKKERLITITPELREILKRRKLAMIPVCPFIFQRDGKPIVSYRVTWRNACVLAGLGKWMCRACRDHEGKYISVLDAKKVCSRCGQWWEWPRYEGRLFHDFRRSCTHELWKAGCSIDDC